jgi:SAM-dependent methyltransferase
MRKEEYATMFSVEDAHFWYRGLRALLTFYWRRHGSGERPRFLDMGCGTGATMALLRHWGRPIGFDLEPEALRFTATRQAGPLLQASVAQPPFADACFDAALLMDVLQHLNVPDRHAPLREALRILRPGGLLFVNVPAFQWLRSSHDEAVHTGHRFTRPEVVSLLKDSGFEFVDASYWNTALFPAIVLTRLLRKGATTRSSDLDPPSKLVGALCGAALKLERGMLRLFPLPFGLSIFAVARKPEGR